MNSCRDVVGAHEEMHRALNACLEAIHYASRRDSSRAELFFAESPEWTSLVEQMNEISVRVEEITYSVNQETALQQVGLELVKV